MSKIQNIMLYWMIYMTLIKKVLKRFLMLNIL